MCSRYRMHSHCILCYVLRLDCQVFSVGALLLSRVGSMVATVFTSDILKDDAEIETVSSR